MIVVLVGPSCSGKSTCVKLINSKNKLITCTTRSPRENEINGIDYIFVSQQQFNKLKKLDMLFETNKFGNHWYGLPKDQIENALKKPDENFFVILNPDGALKLKKEYPKDVIIVYFYASKETVKNRLKSRNDLASSRMKEIDKDLEFKESDIVDWIIYNDNERKDLLFIQFFSVILDLYHQYGTKTSISGLKLLSNWRD